MTVHQKEELQSRTKSGNLSRSLVLLNAYGLNQQTPFRGWKGKNQAAFCKPNNGKLPNLKCGSVILLMYDRSHRLCSHSTQIHTTQHQQQKIQAPLTLVKEGKAQLFPQLLSLDLIQAALPVAVESVCPFLLVTHQRGVRAHKGSLLCTAVPGFPL